MFIAKIKKTPRERQLPSILTQADRGASEFGYDHELDTFLVRWESSDSYCCAEWPAFASDNFGSDIGISFFS